jgi:hypothetical protein
MIGFDVYKRTDGHLMKNYLFYSHFRHTFTHHGGETPTERIYEASYSRSIAGGVTEAGEAFLKKKI